MNRKLMVFILAISVLLSACSTLNHEFSCNLTAGDRCLSIDEVNAMTEDCEGKGRSGKNLSRTQKRAWIAPWKDSNGRLHKERYVYLDNQTSRLG